MDRRNFMLTGSAYTMGSFVLTGCGGGGDASTLPIDGVGSVKTATPEALCAQDTFDATPAGTLGAGWTDHQTGIPLIVNASGQVTAQFSAIDTIQATAWWSGPLLAPLGNDQMSEIRLVNPTANSGRNSRIGVTVRASGLGDARSYYEVVMKSDSPTLAYLGATPQYTELNKWTNGQRVNLVSSTATWQPGDRMQLCCQGDTIWVQKNDVSLGDAWTFVDPAPIISGRPGVTATNYMKGDDWKAYAIAAAGSGSNVGVSLAFDPATPEQMSLRCPVTAGLARGTVVHVDHRVTGSGLPWKHGTTLRRLTLSSDIPDLPAALVGKIPADAFMGWVVDLQPGTSYDVRLRVQVPGQAEQQVVGSYKTRALRSTTLPAVTTTCTPTTFLAALSTMRAGDHLRCLPGTGYPGNWTPPRVGTPDAPIVVSAATLGEVVFETAPNGDFNAAVRMGASHVVLENLRFHGPGIDTGARSSSIFLSHADDAVVPKDWTIRQCVVMGYDCAIKTWSPIENLTVHDCRFSGNNTWDKTYAVPVGATFANLTWNDAAFRTQGTGNVAFNCEFSGFGDLMSFHSSSALYFSAANYMYRVRVQRTGDDCFETDECSGNCGFYDNTVHNCGAALSVDGNFGAVGFFRNTIVNYARGPLKMTSASVHAVIEQNTFRGTVGHASSSRTTQGFLVPGTSPSVNRYLTVRNNLFAYSGGGRALDFSATVADDVWKNNAWIDGAFFFKQTSMTTAGLAQAATADPGRFGLDRLVPAQPFATPIVLGADISTEFLGPVDATLAADSSARTAGVAIPGVNDGYAGNAPDVGAVVTGRAAPVIGVRAATGGGAADVPAWVPGPGRLSMLTSGGSTIVNTFDVVVPIFYDKFYARKSLTDFSGAVANPYLGSHGALLFRGGGHAANNFNATFALVHDSVGARWVSLSEPTAWFGREAIHADANSTSKATTQPSMVDPAWGDAQPAVDSERRPCAPHSYSIEAVIPPSDGGGVFGTLFEVAPVAANHEGGYVIPQLGPHVLPIDNASGTVGNRWARVGTPLPSPVFNGSASAAYHSPQRRTYYLGHSNQNDVMRWFDHRTGTHVVGSGESVIPYSTADAGSNHLLVIPGRNLLLGLRRSTGEVLRISYADIAQAQPTRLGDAHLSRSIPMESGTDYGWAHADYCPLTQKIYVFKTLVNAKGAIDQAAVLTITIPTVLTDLWIVEREAFVSGASAFVPSQPQDFQGPRWLPQLRCFVWVHHPGSDVQATNVYYYRPLGT